MGKARFAATSVTNSLITIAHELNAIPLFSPLRTFWGPFNQFFLPFCSETHSDTSLALCIPSFVCSLLCWSKAQNKTKKKKKCTCVFVALCPLPALLFWLRLSRQSLEKGATDVYALTLTPVFRVSSFSKVNF